MAKGAFCLCRNKKSHYKHAEQVQLTHCRHVGVFSLDILWETKPQRNTSFLWLVRSKWHRVVFTMLVFAVAG